MKEKKIIDNDNSWTIRGINQEVRNAARMAAKKSRCSLGVWLSRKITEAAQEDLIHQSKAIVRKEDVLDILENLSDKFDKNFLALQSEIDSMKSRKKSWLQNLFNKSSKN